MKKIFISAIGQDSHKITAKKDKPLILGGVEFVNEDFSIEANSDGDVILHAITNAVSGITGVNILGKISDEMCKNGIIDSAMYLKEALKYLECMDDLTRIVHISISIEAKRPKFSPKIDEMKEQIAKLLVLDPRSVGITATTGEELTEFGKGNGIFVTALISCCQDIEEF